MRMHGGLIYIAFCMSVCNWTKIHISRTIAPRVMKFGLNMDVDELKVDPEGQCHRSKVKVTKVKIMIWCLI